MAEIEKRIGQKCWIDLNGIESSDEFVEKIMRAINKAEVIIFMHSKRSAKAPYVRKEIHGGIACSRLLRPLMWLREQNSQVN